MLLVFLACLLLFGVRCVRYWCGVVGSCLLVLYVAPCLLVVGCRLLGLLVTWDCVLFVGCVLFVACQLSCGVLVVCRLLVVVVCF